MTACGVFVLAGIVAMQNIGYIPVDEKGEPQATNGQLTWAFTVAVCFVTAIVLCINAVK